MTRKDEETRNLSKEFPRNVSVVQSCVKQLFSCANLIQLKVASCILIIFKFQKSSKTFKMNKAALILMQVLCLTVFVSAGTGLCDLNYTKIFSYIHKEILP